MEEEPRQTRRQSTGLFMASLYGVLLMRSPRSASPNNEGGGG